MNLIRKALLAARAVMVENRPGLLFNSKKVGRYLDAIAQVDDVLDALTVEEAKGMDAAKDHMAQIARYRAAVNSLGYETLPIADRLLELASTVDAQYRLDLQRLRSMLLRMNLLMEVPPKPSVKDRQALIDLVVQLGMVDDIAAATAETEEENIGLVVR